jgi:hypothetical protein
MSEEKSLMRLIFSVKAKDPKQLTDLVLYLEKNGFKEVDNSSHEIFESIYASKKYMDTRSVFDIVEPKDEKSDLKLFKKLCKKWCEKNNAELEWVKYIQKDIGLCFPEDRKKDLEEERAKSIPDPAKKRKNAIAWYIRGSRAKDDMILVIPEKYFGTHGLPSITEWEPDENTGDYLEQLENEEYFPDVFHVDIWCGSVFMNISDEYKISEFIFSELC